MPASAHPVGYVKYVCAAVIQPKTCCVRWHAIALRLAKQGPHRSIGALSGQVPTREFKGTYRRSEKSGMRVTRPGARTPCPLSWSGRAQVVDCVVEFLRERGNLTGHGSPPSALTSILDAEQPAFHDTWGSRAA